MPYRLNPYTANKESNVMVEILCPHCEEAIELDDDASGEFACPYCEGEFEWNTEPERGGDEDAFQGNRRSQRGAELPPMRPIAWFGLGISFFILIFVILCLTSGSLYSITATAGFEGQEVEIVELDYGLNSYSGQELTFEVSSTYNDKIIEINNDKLVFCLIIPDDCESFGTEELEFHESWNQAGNFLAFFVILALLSSIAVLAFRLFLVLDCLEIVALNERMFVVSTYAKLFLPFVIGGLLLIGMILFILISPGADMYDALLAEAFPSAVISSGFGLIVWMSLLLSVVYPAFSYYEMNVE
jgi:hypothetical protein